MPVYRRRLVEIVDEKDFGFDALRQSQHRAWYRVVKRHNSGRRRLPWLEAMFSLACGQPPGAGIRCRPCRPVTEKTAQRADSRQLDKMSSIQRCTYFQDSSDVRLEGAAQNPVNLSRVYQRQSLRGVGLPIGAGKRVATSPRSCIKRLEGGKGVVIRSERSLRLRGFRLSRA